MIDVSQVTSSGASSAASVTKQLIAFFKLLILEPAVYGMRYMAYLQSFAHNTKVNFGFDMAAIRASLKGKPYLETYDDPQLVAAICARLDAAGVKHYHVERSESGQLLLICDGSEKDAEQIIQSVIDERFSGNKTRTASTMNEVQQSAFLNLSDENHARAMILDDITEEEFQNYITAPTKTPRVIYMKDDNGKYHMRFNEEDFVSSATSLRHTSLLGTMVLQNNTATKTLKRVREAEQYTMACITTLMEYDEPTPLYIASAYGGGPFLEVNKYNVSVVSPDGTKKTFQRSFLGKCPEDLSYEDQHIYSDWVASILKEFPYGKLPNDMTVITRPVIQKAKEIGYDYPNGLFDFMLHHAKEPKKEDFCVPLASGRIGLERPMVHFSEATFERKCATYIETHLEELALTPYKREIQSSVADKIRTQMLASNMHLPTDSVSAFVQAFTDYSFHTNGGYFNAAGITTGKAIAQGVQKDLMEFCDREDVKERFNDILDKRNKPAVEHLLQDIVAQIQRDFKDEEYPMKRDDLEHAFDRATKEFLREVEQKDISAAIKLAAATGLPKDRAREFLESFYERDDLGDFIISMKKSIDHVLQQPTRTLTREDFIQAAKEAEKEKTIVPVGNDIIRHAGAMR